MSRAVAVGSLLAVLVTASCGDPDDDDTSATSAPSAATAPVSSEPPPSSTPVAPGTPPASTDGTASAASTGATASPTSTVAAATGAEPAVTLSEIGSFAAPVDLAWREGDAALYVVEQGGTIQRVADGELSTVLDITDLTEADGERGLLGMTFSPGGDLAYVNYTDLDGHTTIAELPVDADGNFGSGDGARTVLVIEQPYPNHNGGDLTFGPDGLLYIGMGDGGAGGDPERRATDPAELLGKLLRIDPTPSGDLAYTVPPDNPFVDEDATAPEIWSSGLRNPWKFSFDRQTGDLWIADVGQDEIEEVDVAPAAAGGLDAGKGESFGWSALEGDAPFNEDVEIEDPVPPLYTYTHDEGCSISGGVRARGGPVTDLVGWYVFGDFCAGRVWALEVLGEGADMEAGRRVDLGELSGLTAVVDGPDGEVYALSGQGPVVRLDPG